MVFVDMDSLQFYNPPAEASLRTDGRPTISNLGDPAPRWSGKNPAVLEASQESRRVLHNPDLIQPQNTTGPLESESLESFRAPGVCLNSTKVDRKIASTPSERAVTSWDEMIPLLCQKGDDRPRFRHPPGTPCEPGILGKPTAGESACEQAQTTSRGWL